MKQIGYITASCHPAMCYSVVSFWFGFLVQTTVASLYLLPSTLVVKINIKFTRPKEKNTDLRTFIYFNTILYFGIVEAEIFASKVTNSCDTDDLSKEEK